MAWFSSSRDFLRVVFRLLLATFIFSEVCSYYPLLSWISVAYFHDIFLFFTESFFILSSLSRHHSLVILSFFFVFFLFSTLLSSQVIFHDDPLETRYLSKTSLPSLLPSTFDPFSLSYITKGFSGPSLPPQSSWFSSSPPSFVSVQASAENIETALKKPLQHRASALTLASEAHFAGHEAAWNLLWNTLSSSWEKNQIPPAKIVASELYDCVRRAVYLPFVFLRSMASMGATASLSDKTDNREFREESDLASLFTVLKPILCGPARLLSDLFFRVSEGDRDCWGVGCTCKIRGQCSFTRITSNDTISSQTAFAAEDAMQEAADSILCEGRVQKARPAVLLYSHPFENGSDSLFFVSLQPSANAMSFESPHGFLSTQSALVDKLRESQYERQRQHGGENALADDKTSEIEAKKALRRTFYSLLREHYLSFDWLSVARTKRPLKTTAKKPIPLYSYIDEVSRAGTPEQSQQPQHYTNIFHNILDHTMSTIRGEEDKNSLSRRHSLALFNGDIYAERYFTDFEQAPWVLPHEWLSATHRRHLDVISVRIASGFLLYCVGVFLLLNLLFCYRYCFIFVFFLHTIQNPFFFFLQIPVPSIFLTKGKFGSLIKSTASYISWELSNTFK